MQRFVYLLLIALLATPTLAGYGQAMKEKPEVVATGRFTDKEGQHTSGTYRIERVEEDLRLVLSDDFKTDKGPDLHVVLSPTTALDATNDNALANGTALVVAQLTAFAGAQTYDLPDDTDLAPYKAVLIHCIQYTHLFGAAPLER